MKRLNLIDKAFLLKRTPFFGALDLDLLLPIADKMQLAGFDSGDIILPHSEEVHRLYFVAKGHVLIRNEEHVVMRLSTAECFGDEPFFSEKPATYEAVSETETSILTLSRNHLSVILSECPSVGFHFLREYASQLPLRRRQSLEDTP